MEKLGRPVTTLRTIAASYWTPLALAAAAVFLHVRWYTVAKAPGVEVVSGFGAALVALGLLVASRPYIRAGFAQLIAAGLPQYDGAPFSTDARWKEHLDRIEVERPKVLRDVVAERVGAVVVVILGTLLNGYGPLVAGAPPTRLLDFKAATSRRARRSSYGAAYLRGYVSASR